MQRAPIMLRSLRPLLAIALIAFSTLPAAAQAPLIPRDAFFGNPARTRVRISPDGRFISYLAPFEGVLNVWVRPIDGGNDRPVTRSEDRPIRTYLWAENGQQILYLQDQNGDENNHLYAVSIESGKTIDLTPYEDVKAWIVGGDRQHPDTVLVALNKRTPQLHDVWSINTRTGDSIEVFENDGGYSGFVADSNLDVRIVTRYRRDGGVEAFIRKDTKSPWYELARWPRQDAATSQPLAFNRSGDTVYIVDSRNTDTGQLFAYSTDKTGAVSYENLAGDRRADVSQVLFDPSSNEPMAVSFEYDRSQWNILDPGIAEDWNRLQSMTEGEVRLTSQSSDNMKWIVADIRDDGPAGYYLFDRASSSGTFLFSNRPELEQLDLASMEPVVLRSRDGLRLVSYLTRPTNGTTGRAPMVLLVHGGPWARDRWGYNPLHQWLANRGYAVLSVNFRGSTGFGKAFVNAGDREWARAMHNDLIDAVNWAIEEGIADPNRVAIMGGSYGGYAALVGLTFTPEFFAAGVSIVGPSHIRTLLASIPPHWEPIKAMFEARVGRLDEEDYLDSISPLTRVDDIQRPLLIGQGANDPRVKEAESRQIVDAMQQKNLPVTYVLFPDEGHGFARPENNLAFFAITEAFLAEHLGGRMQPMESDLRQSSAIIEAGGELIPELAEAAE